MLSIEIPTAAKLSCEPNLLEKMAANSPKVISAEHTILWLAKSSGVGLSVSLLASKKRKCFAAKNHWITC